MVKKLSLLLAAVAVLAFAVPAMANASGVTSSKGVLAPLNSKLTGTGSEIKLTSATLGTIVCKKLTILGSLTKNEGGSGTVEAEGVSEKPGQETCLNGTKAVVVTSIDLTKLVSSGSAEPTTGTVNFTATIDIAELECTFTGKEVPFTYTNGSSSITFTTAAGITSTPAACGSAKLDGSFLIEIGSTAVILD